MFLPAPFARGLLVTASLAACCLAIPAHGQYSTTKPYMQPGLRSGVATAPRRAAYSSYPSTAYAGRYAARQTSTYGGQQTSSFGGRAPTAGWSASGYSAPKYYVAQALEDTTPIDVPQPSPSDMPPPGTDRRLVGSGGDGYTPPPAPTAGWSAGGYGGGADCFANGAVGYMNYSPSCNCLDGGYSTWGFWDNYRSTSPCNGAGCQTGFGLLGGCRCGGVGCSQCGGGCAEGSVGGCASCQLSTLAPCRVWFGGVYALFMDRDLEDPAYVSYDSSNLANQVLSSRDASVDWQPGNEVRFGSTFVCSPLAWEAVWWALYDETDDATVTSTTVGAPVRSVLDFSGLDYDPGTGVSGINSFFDDPGTGGVAAQRVSRHFAVQNIELNMIYFPLMQSVGPLGVSRAGGGYYATPVCNRFSLVGTAGVRYFRADDGFQLASSPADTVFGNASDDMFYDIEMENHLIGFQFGAAANYQATQAWSFYADSKFGIFANYIEHSSRIYGSNGVAVVTGGLPYAGEAYDIQSNKTDVSFLGELRVGAAYVVLPHWRLYGGWRAVGIVGYAQPTEQIPQYFVGIPDIVNINSNGSLIVHGLQAGVEFAY